MPKKTPVVKAPTKPAKPKKTSPTPTPTAEAKVLYPVLKVVNYSKGTPEGPINAELAKKLLGWTTEEDAGYEFGDDYLLVDENGNKIRCLNNTHNRPYYDKDARKYAQGVLRRHWSGPSGNRKKTHNCENIIIGCTGQVLSGQHRLIAEVLATQMWEGPNSVRWQEFWPDSPPVIDAFVAFGCDESVETLRTMDSVRPRTLADVLYTENAFTTAGKVARAEMTKILEHAVRFMWSRIGMGDNAFSPFLTNTMAMEFVSAYPKLNDAVSVIYNIEKADGRVTDYLATGYAAGLLYMMAASETDSTAYFNARREDTASEELLDFSMYDKAVEFWTELGATKPSPKLRAIREARRPLIGDVKDKDYSGYIFVKGKGNGGLSECIGVLIKAWNRYKIGKPITHDDLALKYHRVYGEDGSLIQVNLLTFPTLEGIDMEVDSKDDEDVDTVEPSDAELADRIEKAKLAKDANGTVTPEDLGDDVIITEDEDEEYDLVEEEPPAKPAPAKPALPTLPGSPGKLDLNDPSMPFVRRKGPPNNRLGGMPPASPPVPPSPSPAPANPKPIKRK